VRLITGLKFQRHLAHAAVTSDLFLDRIKAAWYQAEPLPDILLPMPLHDSRMQQRGYNQALEIAKPLAKACRMALDQNGIRRIKATQAQSGLSAKERAANLAGAFQAQTTYQDLRVAILDDVVTTGHTVNALANCLKQAGALDIHIWCVARA
jgi:ComF family protein